MTSGMDEKIRQAVSRPSRNAGIIFKKKPTPAEGESSKLQAEIDELRVAIKENHLNLKYSE